MTALWKSIVGDVFVCRLRDSIETRLVLAVESVLEGSHRVEITFLNQDGEVKTTLQNKQFCEHLVSGPWVEDKVGYAWIRP